MVTSSSAVVGESFPGGMMHRRADLPEPGCVQHGYGSCLGADRGSPLAAAGWALRATGLWRDVSNEQRERAARSGRRMAEAARPGAPSEDPNPHSPLRAPCGGRSLSERRGGKQFAANGTRRPRPRVLLSGASLVTLTCEANLTGAERRRLPLAGGR